MSSNVTSTKKNSQANNTKKERNHIDINDQFSRKHTGRRKLKGKNYNDDNDVKSSDKYNKCVKKNVIS